jgi:hypothetical protein
MDSCKHAQTIGSDESNRVCTTHKEIGAVFFLIIKLGMRTKNEYAHALMCKRVKVGCCYSAIMRTTRNERARARAKASQHNINVLFACIAQAIMLQMGGLRERSTALQTDLPWK